MNEYLNFARNFRGVM